MDKNIDKALNWMSHFKRWVSLVILFLMAIIVLASVIELVFIIYLEVFNTPDGILFLEDNELFRLFGFVFMILIGLELVETIEIYFREHVIHAEAVLLIAVIAVARKIILLDLETYTPMAIIGLGVILIALGGCYFLIKKVRPVMKAQ